MQIRHRYCQSLYGAVSFLVMGWFWLRLSQVESLKLLVYPALVLILPLLIVWILQQRVLRATGEQLVASRFYYLQLLHWLTVVMWCAWIGLSFTSEMQRLLELTLGAKQNLWHESLEMGLLIVLPMLAVLSCYLLSYPIFVQFNGTQTRRELLQQILWQQLQGILPLALFFNGCRLFFNSSTLSLALFSAACASQMLLTQLVKPAPDTQIQALTVDELRNRLFALARSAGVKLKQVYVMSNSQTANAFAIQGNNIVLTDSLLHHLNKREIDAVMAHEIAHLQYRHPQMLQALLVLAVLVGMGSAPILATCLGGLPFVLVVLLLLGIYCACSRYFEYEADRQAALLTNDPVAMIAGLVKLAQLSRIPLNWDRGSQWMMTHPSIRQRVRAVAQQQHICLEQIPKILETCNRETAHYRLH